MVVARVSNHKMDDNFCYWVIIERSKAEQTHRYLTVDHKMNLVFSENTGEYLHKKSEKSIKSSNLNQIEESSENLYETNFIDNEIK